MAGMGVGRCFPLWGQGRIYPMLKQCAARLNAPHGANFMGAAAPIAPMVPTPMARCVYSAHPCAIFPLALIFTSAVDLPSNLS